MYRVQSTYLIRSDQPTGRHRGRLRDDLEKFSLETAMNLGTAIGIAVVDAPLRGQMCPNTVWRPLEHRVVRLPSLQSLRLAQENGTSSANNRSKTAEASPDSSTEFSSRFSSGLERKSSYVAVTRHVFTATKNNEKKKSLPTCGNHARPAAVRSASMPGCYSYIESLTNIVRI